MDYHTHKRQRIHRTRRSTNPAHRVPEDVMLEIFIKLPVKAIGRFKSVSKAWYRLLSSPSFIKKLLPLSSIHLYYSYYVKYPRKRPGFHNCTHTCISLNDIDGGHAITYKSLSFLPFSKDMAILDSCNGLILGEFECRGCYYLYTRRWYYVCNPVTRTWAVLPPGLVIQPLYRITPRLQFDPQVSHHFKVVCFLEPLALDENGGMLLEIFSSEDGKWELVSINVPHPRPWKAISSKKYTAFVDGSMYLFGHPHQVLKLNLTEFFFGVINLPGKRNSKSCLGEFGGALCYAECHSFLLRIWVLKDWSSENWVLKHKENIKELLRQHLVVRKSKMGHLFSLYGIHPDSETVFFGVRGKIVAYQWSARRMEKICNLWRKPYTFRGEFSPRMLPFSPCLINPLKNIDWN